MPEPWSLEARLAELVAECPGLDLIRDDGGFIVTAGDEAKSIHVRIGEDDWQVEFSEWHGHYETPESAVRCIAQLIAGYSRVATLHRASTRAMTWLEEHMNGTAEISHVAIFLSPFDSEDWRSRLGERWTVTRTLMRLVDGSQLSLFKNVPPPARLPAMGSVEVSERSYWRNPFPPPENSTQYLERQLGRPPRRSRWTLHVSHRLAIPMPSGWRHYPSENVPKNGALYVPRSNLCSFLVKTFFRAAEIERGAFDDRPLSVERIDERTYQAHFSDGLDEMLVQVIIGTRNPNAKPADWLCDLAKKCLEHGRYLPNRF